jgi:ParB-like chromosome segregation protein Spo0J
MNIVDVPMKDIEEAPFNYNLHPQNQIDELRGSLEEFGQFKNIVLWKGYCIAGNGLTFAARSMGWESLKAVIRDELTEEQAKRLCLADNATPYLAMPDSQKLEDLLKSLPSFEDIPGVNDEWLQSLNIEMDLELEDVEVEESEHSKDSTTQCPKCGFVWQE